MDPWQQLSTDIFKYDLNIFCELIKKAFKKINMIAYDEMRRSAQITIYHHNDIWEKQESENIYQYRILFDCICEALKKTHIRICHGKNNIKTLIKINKFMVLSTRQDSIYIQYPDCQAYKIYFDDIDKQDTAFTIIKQRLFELQMDQIRKAQ